jgi:hypothetical protein
LSEAAQAALHPVIAAALWCLLVWGISRAYGLVFDLFDDERPCERCAGKGSISSNVIDPKSARGRLRPLELQCAACRGKGRRL